MVAKEYWSNFGTISFKSRSRTPPLEPEAHSTIFLRPEAIGAILANSKVILIFAEGEGLRRHTSSSNDAYLEEDYAHPIVET